MILTILDTETTGLDHEKNDVVEIGIVNFDTDENEIITSESILVCPKTFDDFEKTVPIHGIKKSLIDKHGIYFEEAVRKVKSYITPKTVMVAHNAEFDRGWFKKENEIFNLPWVCTKEDVKWPEHVSNNHLISIAIAHGVAVISAHRALEDCLTIARLLKRVGENHDLNKMITLAMRPKGIFVANVSFAEKDLAKESGFKWIAEKKVWQKRMFLDDVDSLKFPVIKVQEVL